MFHVKHESPAVMAGLSCSKLYAVCTDDRRAPALSSFYRPPINGARGRRDILAVAFPLLVPTVPIP